MEEVLRITEDELAKSKPVPIKQKDLYSKFDDYNFKAIYQRYQGIWTNKMKSDLIISMFCGVPCGFVHVVAHPKNMDYWLICDGIQRWGTVRDFMQGKFSVKWKGRAIKYVDLKKPESVDLYRNFMSYVWDVREWPTMSILKQRDLFERINANAGWSSDEKIYCINFFTKSFLLYVHELVKTSLGSRLTSPVVQDKRFGGIAWTHALLHVCFGHDLRGTFRIKPPSFTERKISAQDVNDYFLKYFGEEGVQQDDNDDNIINDEVLKQVRLYENVELLKKTLDIVSKVFNYSSMIKQKPDKNAMKDLIIWTLNHLRNKTLSSRQILDDKGKTFSVFRTFIYTRPEQGLTQKQTNIKTRIASFDYLDNLCLASGMDLGIKGEPLTELQKSKALAKSNHKCKLCQCDLSHTNAVFDHVLCKSRHGESEAACICSDCNARKSDWTAEELMKYALFIAEARS